MMNREAIKLGDRVKIIDFAVGNTGPQAVQDRRELVGRTGTVLEVGLYISVQLDEDPAHIPAAVLCVAPELELLDADADEARTA